MEHKETLKIVLAGLSEETQKSAEDAARKAGTETVTADNARELVYLAGEGADAAMLSEELASKRSVLSRLRQADPKVFSVACLDASRRDPCMKALSLGHDDFLFLPVSEAGAFEVLKKLESWRMLGLCGGKVRGVPLNIAPFKDVVRSRLEAWMEDLPQKAFNPSDGEGWRSYFLETMDRELLSVTLEKLSGNRNKTAGFLGMHRNTLNRRIKELGIIKPNKK